MAVSAPAMAAAIDPRRGFNANTRRKVVPMAALVRPVGGGTTFVQLPKTGLLGGLHLAIRGTVGGTVGTVNALGMASIIRRVRLTMNSGVDVVNITGPGYHYLLRDLLESEYIDPCGQSNARSAVTATAANLDMWLPMAVNLRDPVGLIALQNEQTIVTLSIDWEADATVTSTGTFAGFTVVPYLVLFTVPTNRADRPPLNRVHNILEDTQSVAAAGDQTYNWQRSNVYAQTVHGLGFGVAGTDAFSRFRVRVNQSDYLLDVGIDQLDMEFRLLRGRARPAGVIPFDLLGTSGLGNYGLARDLFDSGDTTDLASIITATGAGTLYTVRRQLITLGGPA